MSEYCNKAAKDCYWQPFDETTGYGYGGECLPGDDSMGAMSCEESYGEAECMGNPKGCYYNPDDMSCSEDTSGNYGSYEADPNKPTTCGEIDDETTCVEEAFPLYSLNCAWQSGSAMPGLCVDTSGDSNTYGSDTGGYGTDTYGSDTGGYGSDTYGSGTGGNGGNTYGSDTGGYGSDTYGSGTGGSGGNTYGSDTGGYGTDTYGGNPDTYGGDTGGSAGYGDSTGSDGYGGPPPAYGDSGSEVGEYGSGPDTTTMGEYGP
jgi:hypothetical protein